MIPDKEHFEKIHAIYDTDLMNRAMDKKLIINVAPTGAFIKREQNPNQAYTPREVARQVIESYKMGASVWHVHVRNEKGIIQQRNIPPILEALDMVLDECPDMILSQSGHVDVSKRGVDCVSPLVEPLYEAGKKSGRNYLHTMVLLAQATNRMYMNEQDLKAIVEYIQSRGMRAEFQIDGYRSLHNTVSWVIRSGEAKKPYIMNLLSGTHGSQYVGPTLPDPWGQLYLMSMLASIETLVPNDLVTGATIGGHNWLPLTVQAIMLGVDCVRIGMEDTLWMYPHKDDVIPSCAEVIRKVATIAKELGREIATPQQAREILGIKAN